MEIKPPVEIRLGLIKSTTKEDSFFLFARGATEGFEDRLAKMGFHYDPVKDGFRRPFDCYIIDELRAHPLDYEVTDVVSKQYYYEKEKIKPYPFFPSAELKIDLFPFQKVGRDFILENGSCIVADEMGLGKTSMALAAAERWGSKCLVVSRASLLRQWETEIEKFTSSSFEIIEGTPKKRKELWASAIEKPCHYAVVSYDTLNGKDDREGALAYIKDSAMAVYDEITMVKNYTASRTKAISVLRPHVVIGLTGTPYENHVGEYYQIFRLVRPGLLPPYEVFMDLFTIRESRQIRTKSGRKFSLEMIKKEINLELLAKMVAPAMIRRMRKEVLSLPPSEPIVHNIGMSKLQRQIESFLLNGARLHEELRLPFFTFGLENAICPAMLDSQKIPDNIDLLRLIELLDEMKDLEDEELSKTIRTPRLEEVGHILDEAGDSKVVIYSRFTKALDLIDKFILQQRGIEPAYFTGFARESKMFIEGDKRVLLMSGAGAYGLNLQEVCHLMILVDKPFNPAVLDQVKGRIDRIGQKNPMQYHEFDTGSTIERRAFEIIKRKGETSDILLAKSVMG